MKESTLYVSQSEVLELHVKIIADYGGLHGVKDPQLLEETIFLPQSGYEDKHIRHLSYETLYDQAAALLHGICKNNCFVDGNKRMAVLISLVFLKMNGLSLNVSNNSLVEFITFDVIEKKADIKTIAKWIESNIG